MRLVVTDTLPNCVIPLFLVTGKDEFRQWGSALFLRFDSAFFLVTAAHVVAGQNGNDNLMMQGWDGFLTETPDRWQRTMPQAGQSVETDRDDVAVALLTKEMVAGLFRHDYGCLDGRTIDPLPISTGDAVVFTGYPGDRQTCLHAAEFSLIHLRPHAFYSKIARPSEAIGSGFHSDRYVVPALSVFPCRRLWVFSDQQIRIVLLSVPYRKTRAGGANAGKETPEMSEATSPQQLCTPK